MRRVLALAAAIAALGACDTTEPRVPTAVQVDQQVIAMEVHDTVVVHATVTDQHGRVYEVSPEGFELTWTSSRPSVAQVIGGEIRGLSAGEATIRAQAGSLPAAEVAVTVAPRTVTAQLGFNYSGHTSGSFSVNETFRLDQIDWAGDVAYSIFDLQFNDQDIAAQRRRQDGKYDVLYFWVDGRVTTPGARSQVDGVFVLGYDVATEEAEFYYIIQSGTVNFTSVTGRQLAGTFSLNLQETETSASLAVTAGTFDVPIVTDDELGGDQADTAAFTPMSARMLESVIRLRDGLRR